MRTTFCLRDVKATSETPVYAFVHYGNWQVKLSTGCKVLPKLWNQDKRRAKRGAAVEAPINNTLAKIEADISTIYAAMLSSGEEMTPERFKARYKALQSPTVKQAAPKPVSLFERYDEYKEESKSRVKPASLQIHSTVISHLKKFETKYGVAITYERIDTILFDKLFAYLVNVAQVNNVTAWKILKTFKAFLRYSYERGYTSNTDFTKFTSKRIPKGDKSSKVYLSPVELRKIIDLDLAANPRLDRVRDLYVLQSYTGMRFGDVRALRFDHITGDEIEFITGKNRKAVRIPILPEARRILEKYNYDLPRISTQKQNDYLREVMQAAKINSPVIVVDFKGAERVETTLPKWKLVSTHSAKRSFVTILRSRGVSIESIMRITGNCRATIEAYIVNTHDDAMEEVRAAMG